MAKGEKEKLHNGMTQDDIRRASKLRKKRGLGKAKQTVERVEYQPLGKTAGQLKFRQDLIRQKEEHEEQRRRSFEEAKAKRNAEEQAEAQTLFNTALSGGSVRFVADSFEYLDVFRFHRIVHKVLKLIKSQPVRFIWEEDFKNLEFKAVLKSKAKV